VGAKKLFYMLTAITIAVVTMLAALKLPVPASAAPNQGVGYWTDSFTDSTGISASTNISVSGGDVRLNISSTTLQVNTSCSDNASPNGNDFEYYSQWTLPGSGTVTVSKLWYWQVDNSLSSSETIYMAMYVNGSGYTKINGSDTTLKGTGAVGWISANVSAPFTITLGQTYWIGLVSASGTGYRTPRDNSANCAGYPPTGSGSYVKATNNVLDASVPTGASRSSNKEIIPGITYAIPSGSLNSVSITPASLQNWGQFNASHNLPSGTGITYKILNAANDSVICTITAAQAAAGYNISSCAGAASSIKLRAEFSTSNISQTPILYDWGVTWVPVSLTTSAGLYEANRATAATSITPQSEYAIKVRVTDPATLNNLSTVKVTLYYDLDGTYSPLEIPASGNTQTCAILTCTVGATPSWTISPGDSTSCALVLYNCSQPGLSGTGGDFWLHFKAGKVATQTTGSARWHIYANVSTTVGFTVSNYQANLNMNWYGEIQMNTASVDWGLVSAGLDFADSDPSRETNISVTYISNGAYSQQVKSSTTWAGVSSNAILKPEGNPGPNQFSLRADYDNTLNGSVLVPALYTTFRSGTQTGESGNTESANSLWLKLGTPFQSDQYNGSISYRIAP
jgi:hypothetical protein